MTLTDSGGLQKEAFFLNCPAITLRDETEWVETIRAGANILTGADPNKIVDAVSDWQDRLSAGPPDFSATAIASFGDGHAAEKIHDALLDFCSKVRVN
jgi:UDP-N-acetylglucosamine 2-epimerase